MSQFLDNLGARQATVTVDFGLDAVRVAMLRGSSDGAMQVHQAFTLPAVDLGVGVPESTMEAFRGTVNLALQCRPLRPLGGASSSGPIWRMCVQRLKPAWMKSCCASASGITSGGLIRITFPASGPSR